MSNKGSVIIIGGGSFGISAAIELHQRGWEVDVRHQSTIATSTDEIAGR